jgi:hypothetical protein
MISEAASKKRGRPRALAFDADLEAIFRSVFAGKCDRSMLNGKYAALAAKAVSTDGNPDHPDPRYSWFSGLRLRLGVMTELGRLANRWGDDIAQYVADELIVRVNDGRITTTRQAELWILRARREMAETM